MLETYVSTGLGIVVSVLLFLVGYRQTVGARKERARAGNVDLEKTLMKRLVLEEYAPHIVDLEHLIAGKAYEQNVPTRSMALPHTLLNLLYSKVLESDFITADKRRELLLKLDKSINPPGPAIESDIIRRDIFPIRRRIQLSSLSPLVLAVASALIGTSLIPILEPSTRISQLVSDGTALVAIPAAFGFSIAVMGFLFVVMRFKETRSTEDDVTLQEATLIDYESEVASELRKVAERTGYQFLYNNEPSGADFVLKKDTKIFLFEAKFWGGRIHRAATRFTVEYLNSQIARTNAIKAFIVTPRPVKIDFPLDPVNDRISVVSKKQLSDLKLH